MFESTEVGNSVSKKDYQRALEDLRVDLLNMQFDLQHADFSVLLLLMGDDRWGVNEVVDVLHEWLDARLIDTQFFGEPTEEERERPKFWRYWRRLPAKGRIGLHIGAWALGAIADRLNGSLDAHGLERRATHARRFERLLAADGTLVIKIWCHLSKKELAKRLKKAKKHPEKEWYVERSDWEIYDDYDQVLPVCEQYVERTSISEAPWHVIESVDDRYRNLSIAQTLLTAVRARLDAQAPTPQPPAVLTPRPPKGRLDAVDLTASLDKDSYKAKLAKYQAWLNELTRKARNKGISTVLAFEGWDAGGKGGAIRRITRAMAARDYRVVPIAAPTDEEKAHHYLWRFWRHLPRSGRMAIFDRSWYGRVLVERVEGFARQDEWQRAFEEIVDFEAQIAEHGTVVHKFWLHISPEEQLARFKAREQTPYKKYKITSEDYRNRDKWDAYADAVEDMIARTDTETGPWTIVAANDKRMARVTVIKTVCDALERRIKKD